MVSPDRLERYSDFVDPERTGAPYDPRQGLEKLMGVLSPDPKGIVLASMGQDWYGGESQIQNEVIAWLRELDLGSSVWPIRRHATWSYCESRDKQGRTIDGSLVELGAVVKKAEDSSQVQYSRSLAGAELSVPIVQQAVRFVSQAKEYAERQESLGRVPHKFDSMWKIISSLNSSHDQRRPLALWDTINFLIQHPGKHRKVDIHNETRISEAVLQNILASLGNCGIIDYFSPQTEVVGYRGRGWAVYRLSSDQPAEDLDPDKIFQDVKAAARNFTYRSGIIKIVDYIRQHPDSEYENRALTETLAFQSDRVVSEILSLLANQGLLVNPGLGFRGRETMSSVSANDLTFLFNEFVCAPAKTVADTLSSLPLSPWNRQEVAIFLQNYDEERSPKTVQAVNEQNSVLVTILSQGAAEKKLSHIADLYNEQATIELKPNSIKNLIQRLIRLGIIERSRPGFYRMVKKISN